MLDMAPILGALADLGTDGPTGLLSPIPLSILSVFALLVILWFRRTRSLAASTSDARMKSGLNWDNKTTPRARKPAPRVLKKR